MKQPELGQAIAHLRKKKKLTQEDLVALSNISIRTIQRIESGEVTPRYFTSKQLFDALEYNDTLVVQHSDVEDNPNELSGKNCISQKLKQAQIAAIVYFLASLFQTAQDSNRISQDYLDLNVWIYSLTKILLLTSIIFYKRGFIILAELTNNYLLKISSLLVAIIICSIAIYDILSLFYDANERKFVQLSFSFCIGFLLILNGLSIRILQHQIASIAKWAGVFMIASGILFCSIIFWHLGLIFLVPVGILEIIILNKYYLYTQKSLNQLLLNELNHEKNE